MVSVKFYCPKCKKAYHIDELGYSQKLLQYHCPNKNCGYVRLEIHKAEKLNYEQILTHLINIINFIAKWEGENDLSDSPQENIEELLEGVLYGINDIVVKIKHQLDI